jgi:hypothetical protein
MALTTLPCATALACDISVVVVVQLCAVDCYSNTYDSNAANAAMVTVEPNNKCMF